MEVNPGEVSSSLIEIERQSRVKFAVYDVTRYLRLPPPYLVCGKSSDMLQPVDGRYNRLKCVTDCKRKCCDDKLSESFGCRSRDTTFNRNLPLCPTDTVVNCSACVTPCYDHCPLLGCTEERFTVDRAKVATSFLERFYTVGEYISDISLVRASTAQTVTYTSVPLFTLPSLLAELGGQMGLFVGISVLSLVHLIEFMVGVVFGVCGSGGAGTARVSQQSQGGDQGEEVMKGLLALQSSHEKLRRNLEQLTLDVHGREK